MPRMPGDMDVSIKFFHGLGDAANFAHTIPLYTRRGYKVSVECTPDKAPIFTAAGASIVGKAAGEHVFGYPPSVPAVHDWANPSRFPRPVLGNAWESNKAGHSISADPMPDIGKPADLWQELCDVRLAIPTSDGDKAKVDKLLDGLPRPIILWHPQGNSSPELKNLDPQEQLMFLHHILDAMRGTVISLDWDNRVVRTANYRVRHQWDDWRWHFDVPQLVYLFTQADLFIGVDSGPLHLTRFTDIPAIGLWTRHYPGHFVLPRARTLNLTIARHAPDDRYRRVEFNTLCSDEDRLTGKFIAEQAVRMLAPRWLPAEQHAADAALKGYLQKTRSHSGILSSYIDRNVSFGLVMDHLAKQESPLMVETGCIRGEEDWGGAGFSTYLFGWLLHRLGKGKLHSIDFSPEFVKFARGWCEPFGDKVEVHESHSHKWLAEYAGPKLDVFYSDSADTSTPGYQENCLEEVKLATPHLKDDAIVLIDDTVHSKGEWTGKGGLAVPWLLHYGWHVVHAGYQCLLRRSY